MKCVICGIDEGEPPYPSILEAKSPNDMHPKRKHLKCIDEMKRHPERFEAFVPKSFLKEMKVGK